jgi:isoquinoline 1-oxidoreductase subunit alpha
MAGSICDTKRDYTRGTMPKAADGLTCGPVANQSERRIIRAFASPGVFMANIIINNQAVNAELPGDTPLLWLLRDHLDLTGTKFGCGMALCGACTVHVDGQPVRSCVTTIASVTGKEVTTIEGLSKTGDHPVQRAWIEEDVPQCGYCQSGMIMTSVALLKAKPKPTDADIDSALAGHICRCGTYSRIRKAVHTAAALMPPPAPVPAKGKATGNPVPKAKTPAKSSDTKKGA